MRLERTNVTLLGLTEDEEEDIAKRLQKIKTKEIYRIKNSEMDLTVLI
jgi:hypothetical protein